MLERAAEIDAMPRPGHLRAYFKDIHRNEFYSGAKIVAESTGDEEPWLDGQ
jgi:hypothetical protein